MCKYSFIIVMPVLFAVYVNVICTKIIYLLNFCKFTWLLRQLLVPYLRWHMK